MSARGFCGRVVVSAIFASSALTLFVASAAQASPVAGRVAGYSRAASASPTQSAGVTLVIPVARCGGVPSGGFQGVLAGARLDTPGGNTGGGIAVLCAPAAQYAAVIEINGSSTVLPMTVNPGDTVTVAASESATSSSVTVTDGAQTQTMTGGGGSVTAEDIGDIATNCSGTVCSPVPKSAETHFAHATFDGKSLGAVSAVRGNLADGSGTVEIKSSAKTTAGSFRTAWVSSCGTSGLC